MQLLVSVRSAAEANVALAGGADIIDAKEPSRGSLGAVSPSTLQQICEVIPDDRPLSIALGDPQTVDEILQVISAVPKSPRPVYLKLGFAGLDHPDLIHDLLSGALEGAAGCGIVAVAYVDGRNAGSLPPETICRIAGQAGVAGVLLDTYQKSSGNLLTWLGLPRLASLLSETRAAGLLTAVAGGLGAEQLPAVAGAAPDIVGFRGALCEGGREGTLSEERVRRVRQQLGRLASDSLLPSFGLLPGVGETPGVSAILDLRR